MADIGPNDIQAEFGFLSGLVSIHFPRAPSFFVSATVDVSQNATPSISGGKGTVERVFTITLQEEFLRQDFYAVNLTQYEAEKTQVICQPGVAPTRGNSGGTFAGYPFYDSWGASSGSTTWQAPYVQVTLEYPLDGNVPNPSKQWPYDGMPARGDFFCDPNDPNHWGFTWQTVSSAFDDPHVFSDEMLYIATHQGFDSNGILRAGAGQVSAFPQPFPSAPNWVNTNPPFPTQVQIAATFNIYNGPIMNGNKMKNGFGDSPFIWPRASGSTAKKPWPQGKLIYANGRYGPKAKTAKQVLSDTVQTHANPITEQSSVSERSGEYPFQGQVQRVAQHGGDTCTLPVSWNLRDGQRLGEPVEPNELKLGSTWDGWYAFWQINDGPNPAPDNSYEYDAQGGQYNYVYKP